MQEFYRKATAEELQFYQQSLYPLQDKVFEIASLYGDKLYLTGGTALARFYFHHRLSDDLDFFVLPDDLPQLVNDLSARFQNQGMFVEIEKLEVYFARIYLATERVRLKIEFAREFNLLGALVRTAHKILVNNLDDLGANKITAFEDRAQIKDIIDLYYITRKIPFEQLFILADHKRVPVAYENLLAINTTGIVGQALLTVDLVEHDLIDFVNDLKLKTEAEIKKKEQEASEHIQDIVIKLLWDFPRERRGINDYSWPVLQRRMRQLRLPERKALQRVLG
jgi:predicted nucleotidyltransferase component of viral defense system